MTLTRLGCRRLMRKLRRLTHFFVDGSPESAWATAAASGTTVAGGVLVAPGTSRDVGTVAGLGAVTAAEVPPAGLAVPPPLGVPPGSLPPPDPGPGSGFGCAFGSTHDLVAVPFVAPTAPLMVSVPNAAGV